VFKYDNSNEKLTRIVEIPWTTKDGSQPVDVRPKEFKFSSNGIFIAMTILASLGIIAVLKLLMFNWKQRNHWALRKSIPRLNELMLLGALLVYATVILYGLDGQFFEFTDSSLVTCFLRTIFLAVGFTISYGAVLVRATSDIIELYVKMVQYSFSNYAKVLVCFHRYVVIACFRHIPVCSLFWELFCLVCYFLLMLLF
jgi:hypothetical protein